MSEKEIDVDFEKRYKYPTNIVEKRFNDKILIISVETANWIVLENEKQRKIFYELKERSIQEVVNDIREIDFDMMDLIYVLTQLEAKQFENTNIKGISNNGLCIYLTNKCNLRCKHCYMYAGTKNNDELTTEEVISILTEFKMKGGEVVTFTGGEVTERGDIDLILKHSHNTGLINTVLTNGVAWNDELIERCNEYINEVQISIDGYDEISNSKVRGTGNFNLALNNVDKFIKKGVRVSVAVTPLFNDLKNDKEKYIIFAKKLINKYRNKDFHIKFNFELLDGRELKANTQENKEYSKIMDEIVEACYTGYKEKEFIINHKENQIMDNCGYGGITISSTGDIYCCNRIHELKSYANIRNNNFSEIMEMSNRVVNLSNINNLEPCNKCELKYICGGGCRIVNFNELISIKKKDIINEKHKFIRKAFSEDIKKKYYNLMISTNERLFK